MVWTTKRGHSTVLSSKEKLATVFSLQTFKVLGHLFANYDLIAISYRSPSPSMLQTLLTRIVDLFRRTLVIADAVAEPTTLRIVLLVPNLQLLQWYLG